MWNDSTNYALNNAFSGTPGPQAPPPAAACRRSSPGRRTRTPWPVWSATTGAWRIAMSAACSGLVDTYQSFGGEPAGWYVACGTSEATPLFAGIVALADQVAGHSLGLINPALYAMSAAQAPGLVDVTTGNNSVEFLQPTLVHSAGLPRGPGLRPGLGGRHRQRRPVRSRADQAAGGGYGG